MSPREHCLDPAVVAVMSRDANAKPSLGVH